MLCDLPECVFLLVAAGANDGNLLPLLLLLPHHFHRQTPIHPCVFSCCCAVPRAASLIVVVVFTVCSAVGQWEKIFSDPRFEAIKMKKGKMKIFIDE